jgi:PAS domain S-box-containing protein
MKTKKKIKPPVSSKPGTADEEILRLKKRLKTQALQAGLKNREIDLLRSMIDVLPDCHIFLKDRDSRFITTNGFQLKMLGLASLNDVIGKSDFDFFPHETAENFFRDEQKIIRTGKPMINHEEHTVSADGKKRCFLTTKVPLYYYNGVFSGFPGKKEKRGSTKTIAGIVGLSRDITALKKLEKEREKLINDLRQAIDKIKTLHGLIPICCSCKKIRDDKGYWQQIEMYMHEHADAEFSHGYCPECAKKALEEIGLPGNNR